MDEIDEPLNVRILPLLPIDVAPSSAVVLIPTVPSTLTTLVPALPMLTVPDPVLMFVVAEAMDTSLDVIATSDTAAPLVVLKTIPVVGSKLALITVVASSNLSDACELVSSKNEPLVVPAVARNEPLAPAVISVVPVTVTWSFVPAAIVTP